MNSGQFEAGNTLGGKSKRTENKVHWEVKIGSTPQQAIDNNATDFINWAFGEAKAGNARIQDALIRKLMPDKAVKMGNGMSLPDFQDADLLDLMEELDSMEDE